VLKGIFAPHRVLKGIFAPHRVLKGILAPHRVLKGIFAPHRVQMRGGCRKLRDVRSITSFTVKRILLGKANRIWRYWKLVLISGEIVDTHRMLVGRSEGKAQFGSNAL
jgi:hypothetical protein